jgi:hypothetical protein
MVSPRMRTFAIAGASFSLTCFCTKPVYRDLIVEAKEAGGLALAVASLCALASRTVATSHACVTLCLRDQRILNV